MTEYPLIVCPHCGNANKPQQTYCGYCSNDLYPTSAEQVSQSSPEASCQPDPMQSIPSKQPKQQKLTAKQMAEQQQHTIAKQQQFIEQLRADLESVYLRLLNLEGIYLAEHRDTTPGYKKISTWVAALCGIALIVVLYLWIKSEGGLSAITKILPK